jgi:hypothetical protein
LPNDSLPNLYGSSHRHLAAYYRTSHLRAGVGAIGQRRTGRGPGMGGRVPTRRATTTATVRCGSWSVTNLDSGNAQSLSRGLRPSGCFAYATPDCGIGPADRCLFVRIRLGLSSTSTTANTQLDLAGGLRTAIIHGQHARRCIGPGPPNGAAQSAVSENVLARGRLTDVSRQPGREPAYAVEQVQLVA